MIQFVKKSKNDSKLDDFFQIFHSFSLNALNPSLWERAFRAQSLQNMRAREQNREHRAGRLALKSVLVICPSGAAAQKGGKEKERKKREKRQKNKIRRRNSYAGLQYWHGRVGNTPPHSRPQHKVSQPGHLKCAFFDLFDSIIMEGRTNGPKDWPTDNGYLPPFFGTGPYTLVIELGQCLKIENTKCWEKSCLWCPFRYGSMYRWTDCWTDGPTDSQSWIESRRRDQELTIESKVCNFTSPSAFQRKLYFNPFFVVVIFE